MSDRQKYLFFFVLFVLGSLLIFYKFSLIPKNVSFDEVDFTKLALSLDNKPYTVYSPLATGHSTLYFYILLGSLKLFGIHSLALRLPSAMFGIINVLLLFLIMKNVFKNGGVAFSTACIFLTMRWYFNFARFSFEATFLLFLEMTSIYFLQKFFDDDQKYKIRDLIVSAIFAGLAFHSYYPGRIFFILPAMWILLSAPKKYCVMFLCVVGVIIVPLVWHNTFHPDVRVSQISFLSDPKISMNNKLSGVATNTVKTILMPFWKGDMNGRHNFPGKPALNPILGLLLLSGILISVRRRSSSRLPAGYSPAKREIQNPTLFFTLYLIISIIPTLFTAPSDNPSMLRTFTTIPAIVYFIGLAIHSSLQWNKRYTAMIMMILILLSSAYELRTYFQFQSRVFRNSFEITCPLHEMVKKEVISKECRVKNNLF